MEKKMFSVTASWRNKGERKDNLLTGIILAETSEEALEKFKARNQFLVRCYPNVSYGTLELEDGIYITSIRRA